MYTTKEQKKETIEIMLAGIWLLEDVIQQRNLNKALPTVADIMNTIYKKAGVPDRVEVRNGKLIEVEAVKKSADPFGEGWAERMANEVYQKIKQAEAMRTYAFTSIYSRNTY